MRLPRLLRRSRAGEQYVGAVATFTGSEWQERLPWPGTYGVLPNGLPDRRAPVEWWPEEEHEDGGYWIRLA